MRNDHPQPKAAPQITTDHGHPVWSRYVCMSEGCGHPEAVHVLKGQARTRCSGSGCPCPAYTPSQGRPVCPMCGREVDGG